jgi:hypothetical protein
MPSASIVTWLSFLLFLFLENAEWNHGITRFKAVARKFLIFKFVDRLTTECALLLVTPFLIESIGLLVDRVNCNHGGLLPALENLFILAVADCQGLFINFAKKSM